MEEEKKPLGWTSVEQARLLMKVGLFVDSADMSYSLNNYDRNGDLYDIPLTFKGKDIPWCDSYIPCWSVGKLIDLIPYEPTISLNDGHWMVMFDIGDTERHQFFGDSLIEALVQVHIWLLEWCLKN